MGFEEIVLETLVRSVLPTHGHGDNTFPSYGDVGSMRSPSSPLPLFRAVALLRSTPQSGSSNNNGSSGNNNSNSNGHELQAVRTNHPSCSVRLKPPFHPSPRAPQFVKRSSIMEEAGIIDGDLITHVNGEVVSAGRPVELTWTPEVCGYPRKQAYITPINDLPYAWNLGRIVSVHAVDRTNLSIGIQGDLHLLPTRAVDVCAFGPYLTPRTYGLVLSVGCLQSVGGVRLLDVTFLRATGESSAGGYPRHEACAWWQSGVRRHILEAAEVSETHTSRPIVCFILG